jgi:hypothetical protein
MASHKIFKVSFAPLLGLGDDGQPTKVGRWICFVTAKDPNDISDVLKAKLPEYEAGGFDVLEVVDPGVNRAWSVSVGPEGRSYSLLVVAPDEALARASLEASVKNMPVLEDNVRIGLFRTRPIDLSKEGVW